MKTIGRTEDDWIAFKTTAPPQDDWIAFHFLPLQLLPSMKGVVLAALHLVRLPVWHRNTAVFLLFTEV